MKISQEAREAAEQWRMTFRYYMDGGCDDEIADLAKDMQSLINSTLERAAGVAGEFKQMGYMSDRERDYCQQHGEEIATVIRQLMESE